MKNCFSGKAYNRLVASYIVLLLAIVLAGFQSLPIRAQSQTASASINIENFGMLNENYYRGSQPNSGQLADLKKLGVKTVIDLRKDKAEKASEWARAAGLQYINIPLTTKRPATEEQTTYFLSLVNDPANWPVYVHCKGGRHRTGEMTAIYRITQNGWTADQAYQEMKKYDFEDAFFYPRSLKKYVFTYYDQFLSKKTSNVSADAKASGTAP
ncbi:MAG TPA: dual specificity protein phosphatase family protein [Pyrinomonadaceae bacterium]|nr:dual specificity protein phosphatase family protein [Pyrinomonadaceae bacterium]